MAEKERPTEITEQDVYICESRYMEAERQIRRLPKGLKRVQLSPTVTEDEFYFFRKVINPQKTEVVSSAQKLFKNFANPGMTQELSPLMPRANIETDTEESNDMTATLSIKEESNSSLPAIGSSKKKSTKRVVTGYILFASEVRRSVIAANPDRTFGDISRLIGTEWRNLPVGTKTEYEERAQKQNEEAATRELLVNENSTPQSPASVQGSEKSENSLYECLWDGCDFQFEDNQDFIEHLMVEPNGHIQLTYHNKDSDFQCLWQNCSRLKKNVPPFPNLQRLIRHCKEVHLKSGSIKTVLPENRGRNYVPSKKNAFLVNGGCASNSSSFPAFSCASPNPPGIPPSFYVTSPLSSPHPAGRTYSGMLAKYSSALGHGSKSNEPLFLSPPPKTQRLLHSSVYIKYIEGLQPDNRHISNWDSHLKATSENTTVPDPQRLPSHWLANGAGNHGSVVNALWALRNFMLKDSLNISTIN